MVKQRFAGKSQTLSFQNEPEAWKDCAKVYPCDLFGMNLGSGLAVEKIKQAL